MDDRHLINLLGGPTAVEGLLRAQGVSVPRRNIAMWRLRNRIGGDYRAVMKETADAAGVTVRSDFLKPRMFRRAA